MVASPGPLPQRAGLEQTWPPAGHSLSLCSETWASALRHLQACSFLRYPVSTLEILTITYFYSYIWNSLFTS